MNTKTKKFYKYLPLQTENGCITGFIPEDWQVIKTLEKYNHQEYKPCCQDPRNWKGVGDIHPLGSGDPWYFKGYRRWRQVWCSCGGQVIATEYLFPEGIK